MINRNHNQIGLPQRWVVMGVSGCGKSALGNLLAQRLGIAHVEGDSDHPPVNIEKMGAGIPLDDDDRAGWLLLLQARIRKAAQQGSGLVLSCSALKRRYRDTLRGGDPDLIFLHLEGDRDLIASRMQARANHFMPVKLLDSQFRDLEPLQEDERGVQLDIRFPSEALVEQIMQRTGSTE